MIILTGNHGVGKTTYLNNFDGIKIEEDFDDILKSNMATPLKQLSMYHIKHKQFLSTNQYSNIMMDRCTIDVIAYSHILGVNLDKDTLKRDIMSLYTNCEFKIFLVNDKNRDWARNNYRTDDDYWWTTFRDKINQYYLTEVIPLFYEYNIKFELIA